MTDRLTYTGAGETPAPPDRHLGSNCPDAPGQNSSDSWEIPGVPQDLSAIEAEAREYLSPHEDDTHHQALIILGLVTQVRRLRDAINDALDSAETEGLHLGRGTEELREFYRILTEAVETEAGTGA